MDNAYADTVRLLLAVAPIVFSGDLFAMKGGTAINLFVRDMPRLSVDIDVVYLPRDVPREDAIRAIQLELTAIAQRAAVLRLRTTFRERRPPSLRGSWNCWRRDSRRTDGESAQDRPMTSGLAR